MAKIPTDISGRQLRTVLEKRGFVFKRQKGSHMVLVREEPATRVTVPDHRVLRQGTLRQILNDAGMSVEELLDLL